MLLTVRGLCLQAPRRPWGTCVPFRYRQDAEAQGRDVPQGAWPSVPGLDSGPVSVIREPRLFAAAQ